jgi:magnesium transporter
MAEQDQEQRIEERVGAVIGRTAGLVIRLPLDLLGHGVEMLGLVGHGLKSAPGELPGLDLQAPVAEPTTAEKPQITLIDYDAAQTRRAEVEDARKVASRPRIEGASVRWVNVEGLHASTITHLARDYDLHPLAAEDVLNVPQRPKFEAFGDTGFLLCRMLRIEGGQLVDEQVSMFVREGLVITFQQGKGRGDVWDRIRARLEQEGSLLRQRGAGYLAYSLLDAIVDHCFPVLEHYGDELSEIEERLLKRADPQLARRIHAVKRSLSILRRVLWPMRDLVVAVREAHPPWLDEQSLTYLRDVTDHAFRVIDLVETFREMANGLSDLYMTQQSHKMNEVMKLLTVMASLFIPVTFLAGVWGMNFEHMPELEWEYGYLLAWAAFATVVLSLVLFFRRRGWL